MEVEIIEILIFSAIGATIRLLLKIWAQLKISKQNSKKISPIIKWLAGE